MHQSQGPSQADWNGDENFMCFLYVDDAIFVESERVIDPLSVYPAGGALQRMCLGNTAPTKKKLT